jgi:hypothetical protein
MRVMIIGLLAGELGKAARIAIAHGAKLDQADDAETALARLRSDGRFDLVLCELTHNGWIQVVVATRYFVGQSVDTGK